MLIKCNKINKNPNPCSGCWNCCHRSCLDNSDDFVMCDKHDYKVNVFYICDDWEKWKISGTYLVFDCEE